MITILLLSFNQQEYIEQAIQAVLDQDYPHLQIIISDDHSSDDTHSISKSMVEKYSGNHEIFLNRNPDNMGIAHHLNHVMTVAKGDLIIVCAGDDISLPERARELYDVWNSNGRVETYIHSGAYEIDHDGRVVGTRSCRNKDMFDDIPRMIRQQTGAWGATGAWTPGLFRDFPPLSRDVVYEDISLPLRAALIGKVLHSELPLVKYRVGVGVTGKYGDHSHLSKNTKVDAIRRLASARQATLDIKNTLDTNPSDTETGARYPMNLNDISWANQKKWEVINRICHGHLPDLNMIRFISSSKKEEISFIASTFAKARFPKLYMSLSRFFRRKNP